MNTQAAVQRAFPFNLPAEIRNLVYRHALVVPDGGLVRSFTPPALCQTSKIFRAEGMPIFYSKNYFEISIQRSPGDQILAAGRHMPKLDSTVWQRFLQMWDVFTGYGSNNLQHVRHITLIYQISMKNGYDFGEYLFDKRLGFRFSYEPFEEDLDGDYREGSDAGSESDSSDDDLSFDFEELEAEVDSLEAENPPDDGTSGGNENKADTEVKKDPEADFDPVGVFELNRGTFDWPSRRGTWCFLWYMMNEHVQNNIWAIYPIERFTEMLWRCTRDCPLASENVDFLCGDIQYWMRRNARSTNYDDFNDPDDETKW